MTSIILRHLTLNKNVRFRYLKALKHVKAVSLVLVWQEQSLPSS